MSEPFGARGPMPIGSSRLRRVLVPTLISIVLIVVFGLLFVGIWTDWLWFKALGYGSVYRTILATRAGLFVAGGGLFALFIGVNLWLAYRFRPDPRTLRNDDPAARYRYALVSVVRPIFLVILGLALVVAGIIAQSNWTLFQMWWHRTPFGVTDPQFGKDVGFYVFTMPWLNFLESFVFGLVAVTLALVVITHYVFGGIALLVGRGPHVSRAAQIQLASLFGIGVLVKGFGYWLDRFNMMTNMSGLVDGVTYADDHARIPAHNILIAVAVICAVLFFSAIVTRSWTLPVIGFTLLVLTAVLIGGVWPALMQQFQVNPSEPDREGQYIDRNITATREAYGVDNVEVRSFTATTDVSPEQLSQTAETRVSSRIIDPTLVSPAFEQLQQVRGYYTVPDTLDVDRYRLGDSSTPQDVIIAAREVFLGGLQDSQRTWSNDHTVYTHGYGVIAARGNERGAQGEPVWVAQDIPPTGEIQFDGEPQIYYGEMSPDYSIVGRAPGEKPVEVNTPRASDASDSSSSLSTYAGLGGVQIGSSFNRFIYAVRFAEPKIFLSDRVNENSKILYNRVPRDRVQAVAPWLTIDGDTYPAVVDGRIVWIVDAYTTSASYPYSEHRSLREATSDSLTATSAQMALPTDQVNYMRNSVKAVVDAYDGTVTLYAWDDSDPILQTWMKVFPGVVKPKSDISDALMEHLRYPVDLYKVQRDVLSRYHVTDPQTFYEDGERWKVPEDPSSATTALQPPYYLSMSRPGQEQSEFSLSSVYLPNKRQNLAAFMSVNSEATSPNYGQLQILSLPSNTQVGGPNQIAAQFSADRGVTDALLQYEQAKNAKILRGNLLTLPLVTSDPNTGALLYVQPIYIQRSTEEGSYPLLQYVVASFGQDVGVGQTLDEALAVISGVGASPTPDTGGGTDGGTPIDGTRLEMLQQASQYYQDAQTALANGDLAEYQKNVDAMADVLAQLEAQEQAATGS